MLKNILTLCIYFCFPAIFFAQADYFQQEVNYKINARLDDQLHELKGDITIEYINNSPDELSVIHFHLWPNAYKNRKTAYAKQDLRIGNTKFYFAERSKLGSLSDLDFSVEGQSVEFVKDKKNPDMGVLNLGKPLRSGDRITIKTPYTLKIPNSFSRLGHVGESYQMTQWYLKPAVYDKDGWHPMPYLDMGEFYSEFGSFDVSITLPENYLVGATGVLQTEKEKEFLEEQVRISTQKLATISSIPDSLLQDTFPTSSTQLKTIRYTAENIHDFAWFADKRFYVQKSAVTLSNNKSIDTWAFFTNQEVELWKKGTEYLNRSVKHYSDYVGNYPYPQATAVQSALSAGGGMEYPMITVIGLSGDAKSLDEVITHEVGHNWFYGVLGSNERDHPWMDEGLNSYYEIRYMDKYYPKSTNDFLPDFFANGSNLTETRLAYLHLATRGMDQAPDTHSDELASANYWLGAYDKPARILKMLENVIGTPALDKAMQRYYREWEFKHPQPEDFRKVLESETGQDLSWMFDGLLFSAKKMNYAIKDIKEGDNYQITVKNKGEINAPFPISGLKNDSIVFTQWYDGFEGEQVLDFGKRDYDLIVLDEEALTFEIDRRDNNIKTKGGLKTIEPFRFKFLTGLENPKQTTLYGTPLLAWNKYDGPMIGVGLYNITIPERPFEFSLAPLFSFKTKSLNGLANVNYHLYPKSNLFRQITFGLGWKRFSQFNNDPFDFDLQYQRFTPSITLKLNSELKNQFNHEITAKAFFIGNEESNFMVDTLGNVSFLGTEKDRSTIYELSYFAENRRAINPYSLRLALETQEYNGSQEKENYLKLSLEWKTSYTYATGRSVDFRIFGGAFLSNSRRGLELTQDGFARGRFTMARQGQYDYRYDELYFGRNENSGILSQQISIQDGGFKNAFGNITQSGLANNFLIAINVKGDLPQDLPFDLPLKPYFDLGYFDDSNFNRGTTLMGEPIGASDRIWYSGGLMLEAFDGAMGIYFPIVNSSNLKFLYKQRGDFWTRITFNINFNKLSPQRLRNGIELY